MEICGLESSFSDDETDDFSPPFFYDSSLSIIN
jgi:hypothetical protein